MSKSLVSTMQRVLDNDDVMVSVCKYHLRIGCPYIYNIENGIVLCKISIVDHIMYKVMLSYKEKLWQHDIIIFQAKMFCIRGLLLLSIVICATGRTPGKKCLSCDVNLPASDFYPNCLEVCE